MVANARQHLILAWLMTLSLSVMAEQRIDLSPCAADVARSCPDVTPGESRRYQCLQQQREALSANCGEALDEVASTLVEEPFDLYVAVAHLEDRNLGEPNTEDNGEQRVWEHPLPFFAQDAIDLGFELPLPFGVSVIPAAFEQDLTLSDLKVGNSGIADRPVDALDFDNPSVRNTALQFKVDAWLFPFMNVFATVGRVDGNATIPLSLSGSVIAPDACERPNLTPDFCGQTLSATVKPDYEGTNWSVGTTLAMGWDHYFVVLPLVYAVSDIDLLTTDVDAINISPRIGLNRDLGRFGDIALFAGATYLKAEVEVAGAITFEVPGAPEREVTLNYQLVEENRDPWNANIGFNWQLSPEWGVLVEAGFGGSRENLIAGVTYRF
jgi:hypothetical protein